MRCVSHIYENSSESRWVSRHNEKLESAKIIAVKLISHCASDISEKVRVSKGVMGQVAPQGGTLQVGTLQVGAPQLFRRSEVGGLLSCLHTRNSPQV